MELQQPATSSGVGRTQFAPHELWPPARAMRAVPPRRPLSKNPCQCPRTRRHQRRGRPTRGHWRPSRLEGAGGPGDGGSPGGEPAPSAPDVCAQQCGRARPAKVSRATGRNTRRIARSRGTRRATRCGPPRFPQAASLPASDPGPAPAASASGGPALCECKRGPRRVRAAGGPGRSRARQGRSSTVNRSPARHRSLA